MAVSAKWFTNGVKHIVSDASWTGDTIKVLLTTASYTPDQDGHEFKSSITNEVTGTGYSAGGVTLGTKSVSVDAASNETRLIAAPAQWTTATFTCRYAIVWKDT